MKSEDYKNKTKDLIKKVDGKSVIDKDAVEKLWKGKKFEEGITEDDFLLMSVKVNIDRYATFPERLPTGGEMPHPPDEHDRIGLYETKKDLYLILANAYNKVMERIEVLEQEIQQLKNP